jgi:hypothetical protein
MSNFTDYAPKGNYPFIVSYPNSLNIRSQASTNASIVYTVPKGTVMMYLSDAGYANGYKWWRVKYFDFSAKAFKAGYAACQETFGYKDFYLLILGWPVIFPNLVLMGSTLVFDRYSTMEYNDAGDLIGWSTVGKSYYGQSGFHLVWDTVDAWVRCFNCGTNYPERMAIRSDIGNPVAWAYWGCNGNDPGDTKPDYPFTIKACKPGTNIPSNYDMTNRYFLLYELRSGSWVGPM